MIKTFTFEFQDWHLWQANNGFLLSDERYKNLYNFKTVDQAINWLYLNGYKDAARALNKAYDKTGA